MRSLIGIGGDGCPGQRRTSLLVGADELGWHGPYEHAAPRRRAAVQRRSSSIRLLTLVVNSRHLDRRSAWPSARPRCRRHARAASRRDVRLPADTESTSARRALTPVGFTPHVRGARRTSGLRGWLPPPTREPDPGNAGGGSEWQSTTAISSRRWSSPVAHHSIRVAVGVVPVGAYVVAADGGLDHAARRGADARRARRRPRLGVAPAAWPGPANTPWCTRTPPTRPPPTPSSPSPRPSPSARAASSCSPAPVTGSTTRSPRSAPWAPRASTASRPSRHGGAPTACTSPRRTAPSPLRNRRAPRSLCSRCTARRPVSRSPGLGGRSTTSSSGPLVGWGVSNEVLTPPVHVSVAAGVLTVIVPHAQRSGAAP